MPHTPTDMSKLWTRSGCKKCQKLLSLSHQSEISDVPTGCIEKTRLHVLTVTYHEFGYDDHTSGHRESKNLGYSQYRFWNEPFSKN